MSVADDRTKQLMERYDRDAPAYRDHWAPVLRKAGVVLVRELADQRVERVLDIGTGVGALVPDICSAFPGALVVGVDRSVGMLALASREIGRAVMDAGRLAIQTESVDRVLMVFMLFHLEDPVAGVREARRVLRGSGRLGVLTWGGELESGATKVWNECLDACGAMRPDPATETRHDPVDSPHKMEKLLQESGFASAHCWADDLVLELRADHLIRLKTSVGPSKVRFESLDNEAREVCASEARRRMNDLPTEEFVARGRVVYSIGHA